MTKYIIKKSKNEQYYWVLKAANGEPIMKSSETYVSKQACKASILISKICLSKKHFKLGEASSSEFYFIQIADNYEEIGFSEFYTSEQAREVGIESVKGNALLASIEDFT